MLREFPATRWCLAHQRVCHDREHRRGIGLHEQRSSVATDLR